MKRWVAIAAGMTIVVLAGSASATAAFFIDWNCGSYNFSRSGGQISNLKEITYTFGCWRERVVGHGEIEIPYWGTCKRNYNDNIRSVRDTRTRAW
ncbi:MAG TPA: hypothetical protein VI895_13315 [Bdellovibrionota bacterium]|nr:hypothetical protein [Bdellovibrionota bacterium]